MFDGLPDSCGSAFKMSLFTSFIECAGKIWVTETDHPQNSKLTTQLLVCKSCGQQLGIDEANSGGVRFYKWNLCLRNGKTALWQTLPVQKIICAKLLSLIESQATYKFLVYSGKVEDAQEALMVRHTSNSAVYA